MSDVEASGIELSMPLTKNTVVAGCGQAASALTDHPRETHRNRSPATDMRRAPLIVSDSRSEEASEIRAPLLSTLAEVSATVFPMALPS